MDNIVTRQLDDEYELAQLNPVYSQTADGQAEAQSQSKKLDEMPETVNMKFRKAVFEAIVDDLVETKIEQIEDQQLAQNPNTDEQPIAVDAKEVESEVAPVVEKAIAMHKVPSSMRNKIPAMIAKHLRTRNPYYGLLSKVARFAAEEVVSVQEDTATADLDTKPADTGVNIATEEPVVPTGDSAQDPNAATPFIENTKSNDMFARWMLGTDSGLAPADNNEEVVGADGEVILPKVETEPVAEPVENGEPLGDPAGESCRKMSLRDRRRQWFMEDETVASDSAEAVGNDTVGTEKTDNQPADVGTSIEEEVVKVTDCSCQNTENSVPTVQTDALKYLAASCINQRKATALVSRNLTGVLTSKALSDLRNCLPGWYKKKYNLK